MDPNLIYANGLASYLGLLGVRFGIAFPFALLAFSTFVYDTLDVSTRLARYIFQELTGWRGWVGGCLATAVSLAAPLVFLLATEEKAYKIAWPIFGTSNQMLASLTLLAISGWLIGLGQAGLLRHRADALHAGHDDGGPGLAGSAVRGGAAGLVGRQGRQTGDHHLRPLRVDSAGARGTVGVLRGPGPVGVPGATGGQSPFVIPRLRPGLGGCPRGLDNRPQREACRRRLLVRFDLTLLDVVVREIEDDRPLDRQLRRLPVRILDVQNDLIRRLGIRLLAPAWSPGS